MAVLEAFVYDPLINWRLLTAAAAPAEPSPTSLGSEDSEEPSQSSSYRNRSIPEPEGMAGDEMRNERALAVIRRVEKKLRGRDFGNDLPLDVPTQVQKLIDEATSHENLCQCYIGWCPFW